MKKLLVLALTLFSLNSFSQCPTFTVAAPIGTVVGCNPSTLPLMVVNTSVYTNVTYTWVSASTGTSTGQFINASSPTGSNTYTVLASSPSSTCIASQQITIVSNTISPTVTVTPVTKTITCNGAPATFTASSSTTVNVTGQWFGAFGVAAGPASASPVIGSFNAPGTYTAVFTNVANGCTNSQTIAVIGSTVIPTMSITANFGSTIKCAMPCVSISIASNSAFAPLSYSWTNVATSITTTPANGGYSVCVPGLYIGAFKDGFGCTVTRTVNIDIDTARIFPTAITNLSSNSFTLNCNPSTSTLIATVISNPMLSSGNYSWTTPPNITTFTNQVQVSLANITSSTSPTNYTVLCTNPANGCVGRQRVQFYKDIFVPSYKAVYTPTAITCTNPCIIMSPQLSSGTSTVPITFTFVSPPPTTVSSVPGSIFCAPGSYTMNYTNSINGCSATTTTFVPLNVVPPSTVALAPVGIPCGQTTTIVTAGTTTTSTVYTYSWTGPAGAAFSCPTCYSTSVNTPGIYTVVITNTVNGCSTTNYVQVNSGYLNVSYIKNPSSGCVPLSVSFNNSTPFASSSGTVTTSWNFGNGQTVTTTSLANTYTGSATPYPSGTTTYTNAGNYTITLSMAIVSGSTACMGSFVDSVNVSSCIGINELSHTNEINFYPNPNDGSFFIKMEDANVGDLKIYNMLGELLFKARVFRGYSKIENLILPKGIYHMELNPENSKRMNGKLIIN